MGVQANQHGQMTLAFRQRLSILAKDSARVLDILPAPSEKDGICQTNIHTHYRESLEANRASLQKVSHNLPNVVQREEMLRQMSHGQRLSRFDPATKDPMLQILEISSQGRLHLIPLQHL